MQIGIIGSGNMGSALGTIWAQHGHDVTFSYARDQLALQTFTATLAHSASGLIRAGTPAEAAKADVVMLAIPWAQLEDALQHAGVESGALNGRTVITCVSALRPDFTGEATGIAGSGRLSAAEQIAQRVPGARVVEAFNTTFAEVLAAPDREFDGGKPSLLYCGDDADAKAITAWLISECGYTPVDVGGLSMARSVEALASLWVQTAVVARLFPQAALRVLTR